MATQFEQVERYLKARLATIQQAASSESSPQSFPFITISRQAGAGGHSLSTALLDNFAKQENTDLFGGWKTFDRELCEIVVSDERFAPALDSLLNEEYRAPGRELISQIVRPTIDQDIVMNRVYQVVYALAMMGKAIIVGRAGSEVTRELPLGLSIRLVAPEQPRIQRLADIHGVSLSEAKSMARRLDTQRSRLLRSHFSVDIDDPLAYDVTWNTERATFGEIAAATASSVETIAARAARLVGS